MPFQPVPDVDIADTQDIRPVLSSIQVGSAVDLGHHRYGGAFRRYLLLSRVPHLLQGPLDEATVFYNAYYWFRRFIRLRMAEEGYDAGLEQQAFQMLENATIDIDWSIIEQING